MEHLFNDNPLDEMTAFEREEIYRRVKDQELFRLLMESKEAYTRSGRINLSAVARILGMNGKDGKARLAKVKENLRDLFAGVSPIGGVEVGGKAEVRVKRGLSERQPRKESHENDLPQLFSQLESTGRIERKDRAVSQVFPTIQGNRRDG
jgi:hypothetical protein